MMFSIVICCLLACFTSFQFISTLMILEQKFCLLDKYVDDSRTEVLFVGLTAHGLYCNLPL